ncbi:hypothetical protein HXZ66_15695 [Bacillus sp. A116_S68]|jgi:hypothetical protein|nr:hypothetical protein HXZ66_15695 [Bacillus sp. A116_S68]
MRLKDLETNPQNGNIELNITHYDRPILILISEGRVKEAQLPDHGETKVITHQGKLKRVKFEEGEEF